MSTERSSKHSLALACTLMHYTLKRHSRWASTLRPPPWLGYPATLPAHRRKCRAPSGLLPPKGMLSDVCVQLGGLDGIQTPTCNCPSMHIQMH